MYIKKVVIENIRSISHFEMEFPEPAGWHVLIGDNGSGKTSVLQAMALGVLGQNNVPVLRISVVSWIKHGIDEARINLNIERDKKFDDIDDKIHDFESIESISYLSSPKDMKIPVKDGLIRDMHKPATFTTLTFTDDDLQHKFDWNTAGWFSIGFGPFRQFTGGNRDRYKLYDSNPKVAAHLSLYGENIALTEALVWLEELDNRRLREKEKKEIQGVQEPETDYVSESENILSAIKKFINNTKLLPNNAQFDFIDLDGEPVFREPNGMQIKVSQMSNGYQSILGLAFELIRQLVRVYGAKAVFADIEKDNIQIPLPGVVLIDEIDIHLHPTWQTRIGHWFTKYFPNLQFIVTTHSPLICRACEKGSIWRLAAPGSETPSGEITEIDRDRLIYGNILDAYGTEVFGSDPVRSKQSHDKLERLGRLNMLSVLGKINAEEEKERRKLQKILATDDPTGF